MAKVTKETKRVEQVVVEEVPVVHLELTPVEAQTLSDILGAMCSNEQYSSYDIYDVLHKAGFHRNYITTSRMKKSGLFKSIMEL